MTAADPGSGQAKSEVTLKVVEQDGCPLFRRDDKMVVRLPGADTTSGAICVYALAQALPMLAAAARSNKPINEMMPAFRCISGGEHFARFELSSCTVLEEVESGAAQSLRSVSFLQALSLPAMDKVVSRLQTDQYFPRSSLITQDEVVDRIVIVTRGIAEVVAVEPSGFERVTGRLTEGDCFGGPELRGQQIAQAGLRCTTIVQAAVLLRRDLDELIANDPEIALELKSGGYE